MDETRAVTHFFSSPGRHPAAVVDALRELGITEVVVDEEVTGDGFWHVAAFGSLPSDEAAVSDTERRMRRIAQDADARYDGWQATSTTRDQRHR
ncbi:ribonuclease E inhibitor RraB [Lentzea sp. NPDC003310]|uniref:ribonuclease E inhibitor RraB n=1 Tax=Lentzea sp. NPDC003310 TaxID=3154447 RepID=UPI0033B86004